VCELVRGDPLRWPLDDVGSSEELDGIPPVPGR
jgi:hypothetical protein